MEHHLIMLPPSRRLSANLNWLFTELPLLDRFGAAARAGLTGVELLAPYEVPAAELRGRLQDAGLRQVLFNSLSGIVRGASEAPRASQVARRSSANSVQLALEYAAVLDCRLIHLMAGVVPGDVPRSARAMRSSISSRARASAACG